MGKFATTHLDAMRVDKTHYPTDSLLAGTRRSELVVYIEKSASINGRNEGIPGE